MRPIAAALTVLTSTFATHAVAEEWSAVVVGNPTAQATSAFADAYFAAQAFEDLQDGEVYLYRDLDADETDAVLSTALGQPNVILYFAGEVTGTSAAPVLRAAGHTSDGVDLTAYLGQLAENGTQKIALLIETCTGRGSANTVSVTPPDGLSVMLVQSNGSCDVRLTDALVGDGATLSDRLAVFDLAAQPAFDIAFAVPEAAPFEDPALVGRAFQDVITILPSAITPAQPSVVATPVAFSQTVSSDLGGATPATTNVPTIALPTPDADSLAALPLADGFPEPSILVGFVESANEFDQVDPNAPDVSGSELAYDNLDARNAMRLENPDLFANLVSTGAFDPPNSQMERALQTELARMNCYRSGIDGIWGNGSRGAVDRYYVQVGESAPTREPEVELFRSIISRDDVACPTPVAAPAPAPSNNTSRPSSSPSTPRPSTPAPAAPAPAPAAPSGGGGLGDVNLGGVFRG